MRLSPQIVDFFKNEVAKLDSRAEVYLYGSRVDDNKKGGDVDIVIIGDKKYDRKDLSAMYWDFQKTFGAQKLDLLSFARDEESNFKELILLDAINLRKINKKNDNFKNSIQSSQDKIKILKMKDGKLKLELKNNLALLDKALISFNKNFKRCKKVGFKDQYNDTELDSFDSLNAKFARISDIYTQKILKTILLVLQEEKFTLIDRANYAEKVGMVENAQDIVNIRNLRNTIAHDYCIVDISEITKDLLKYSEILIKIIDSTKKYVEDKIFIESKNVS